MKGIQPSSSVPIAVPLRTTTQPADIGSPFYDDDILDIMVFWHNGEFRRDTVYVKNGRISYRELGTVNVAGKNPRQIDALLSEQLKQYLVNYDVVVMLKDQMLQLNKTVGIAGEVYSAPLSSVYPRKGPGEYPWSENLSLLNFIDSSGGLTNKADLRNVKIIHRNGQVIQVDIQEMRNDNLKLQPNDLVYIPARIEADEQSVVVYGLVKKPGTKKMGKGLTIRQAIVEAGGPKYVKAMQVVLLRNNGEKKQLNLQRIWVTKDRSVDVKLKHGDVIYVCTKLTKSEE